MNEKPNIPIHFIKSSIDENALNIVLDNRQCLNDNEINIIELRLFLLFRKVMILLFFQTDAKANSFPLNDFYECSIKENESYPHDDNFFKFKPVFKVKLRENKGFYERILIKDDKFLVVVMNDPYTNSFYRVDILVVFSKISINDKSEPKLMSFEAEGRKNIEVVFDDTLEWLTLKNSYEKCIKNCKLSELKTIQSFIKETASLFL